MFRTIGQSDVAQTPVDPLTTAIFVGKQFRSSGWVDLFFPPTMPLESAASGLARSLSYRYLDEYDTTLPEGTPWPFSGLDVTWFFARPFDLEDYDDSYGAERFAARFAANDGIVLESWMERMIRSTLYPALKEYELRILNPDAAYLFTNTSAS